MDLKTFNSDMARRLALADRLGCSPDYLWQLGVGFRPTGAKRAKRPSPELAQRIEAATQELGQVVPKESMRPDIWPDAVVGKKAA